MFWFFYINGISLDVKPNVRAVDINLYGFLNVCNVGASAFGENVNGDKVFVVDGDYISDAPNPIYESTREAVCSQF